MVASSVFHRALFEMLPVSRPMRMAAEVAAVILGTLVLTLSAKAKVVLGPVDLSL